MSRVLLQHVIARHHLADAMVCQLALEDPTNTSAGIALSSTRR
jgi:hypothetical protein